jgi:hypothetical protein
MVSSATQSTSACQRKMVMTSEKVVEVAEKALDTKDEPVEWSMVKIDASAPLVMTPHPAFQKRTWVGLTVDEIAELVCNLEDPENRIELGQKIEAKLKDKNT